MSWEQENFVVATRYLYHGNEILCRGNEILSRGNEINKTNSDVPSVLP